MQYKLLMVSGIVFLEKKIINIRHFLLVLMLAVAPLVHGEVYYVTKTADTADGSCSATDCSLREAVIASNESTGADTIRVPPGSYALLIAGAGEDAAATGDLDIASEVTILGDPYLQTVVDGEGLDRVFHVVAGVIVRLEWLTIRNGNSSGGGGLAVGHSQANVTLDRCLVIGNTTPNFGGGLTNYGGILYVINTTVTNNTASQGGGVAVLSDYGTTALVFSTIKGNVATTSSNGTQIIKLAGTTVLLDSAIIDSEQIGGSACSGSAFLSYGHNIESPGHTCGLDGVGDMDDVTASSLSLGLLGWNGGPTKTYSIGPASIAVNLGGVGSCPDVDQRGGPRIDGFCDIGSYELSAVPPTALIFSDGFESGGSSAWSNTFP